MTADQIPPVRRRGRRLPRRMIVVCLLVALAAAAVIVHRAFRPDLGRPLPPVVTFEGDRTDAHGDPLPPGAIARLGSLRFRVGPGRGVAWSWDGTRIAAGLGDGRIAVLDARTGKRLQLLEGHFRRIPDPDRRFDLGELLRPRRPRTVIEGVRELAFAPDDRSLVSFGHSIRRTDLRTGDARELLGVIPELRKDVALAPDGTRAAWIDKEVHRLVVHTLGGTTWTEKLPHTMEHPRFTADGRSVHLCGKFDDDDDVTRGVAWILDVDHSGPGRIVGSLSEWATSAAFDGKDSLWLAGWRNARGAWSVARDAPLVAEVADEKATGNVQMSTLAFDRGGRTLAALVVRGIEAELQWIDPATGVVRSRTDMNGAFDGRLEFRRDGGALLLRRPCGVLETFDTATGNSLLPEIGHVGPVVFLAVSPDGRRAASASNHGDVRVWDLASGREVARARLGRRPIGLAFSPDGQQVLAVDMDERAYATELARLDAATGAVVARTRVAEGVEAGSVWAWLEPAGGRLLVRVSSADHTTATLTVRDLEGREISRSALLPAGDAWMRFAPYGRHLESNVGPALVDATTFAVTSRLVWAGGEEPSCWTTTPDGRFAVMCGTRDGHDAYVDVLDLTTRVLRTAAVFVPDHGGDNFQLLTLAVSPDGRYAACGDGDGLWHLFDVPRAALVATTAGHLGRVCDLAFTPGSDRLVTAGVDGTLLVWDVAEVAGD